jgi:uncharacterized protein YkwD
MPRPLPSPPAARLCCALVLISLPIVGCYTGPKFEEGSAWEGDDDDDDASDDESGDAGGEEEAGPGSGADEGADAASGADAGEAGETSGADAGEAGETSGADEAGETSAGEGSESGVDSGEPIDDSVPDTPYCMDVADWEESWTQLEDEILVIVNEVRSQGASCGSEGSFGPAGPLTMNPALRCSSRKHSKDMNDRDFFAHTNPSGEEPWDRMQQAGYSYSWAGENIAGGNATADATMQQWMESDGHCANIMSPDFTEIGVGYYPGGQWGHLWTQNFGTP